MQPHPPRIPPPVTTVETDPLELENAFFATTAAPAMSKQATPAPTKPSPATSSTTSMSTDYNDWRNLPFSSVKRKPMTEIMAYLQAKGLDVIGDDGKPLPKSKLLEAIFSI